MRTFLVAHQFQTDIRQHFVGVHVDGSARAALEHINRGMVMVKKAAALANKELQTIPKSVANTIVAACDEAIALRV
jgi:aspartate ammonia-lyase